MREGPLTRSKAGCVVLDASQVQVVVPSLQVLVYAVALAARLGVAVLVTVVAPGRGEGGKHHQSF